VSLEPVPEAFAELQSHSAHDPNWTVHRVGVADRTGELLLNVSESTPISSFLPVKDDYLAGRPPARVQRTERVPVTTLDLLLGDKPYERIFLKTDTQGYDLRVLAGAHDIVDRLIGIQIELSVVPIYEGMPNYVEALTVLQEMGFILAGMHRVPSFQIHEFDGVFVRNPIRKTRFIASPPIRRSSAGTSATSCPTSTTSFVATATALLFAVAAGLSPSAPSALVASANTRQRIFIVGATL